MSINLLTCRDNHRRETLRETNNSLAQNQQWNGIDDIEFESNRSSEYPIRLYFLCEPQCDSEQLVNLFEIYNEQTRTKIASIFVKKKSCNPVLIKTVPPLCENSSYILTLNTENANAPAIRIDPRFAQRSFTTTSPTTDLDPQPQAECAAKTYDEPRPHYLARDYTSFRQLLLDRLSLIIPGWTERRVPDFGMTLVELFSYVGDYLAYYQDAVATEAYLNTARQRISIRRHARLVDYKLHEGCNARTYLQFEIGGDSSTDSVTLNPDYAFFITEHPDPLLKNRPVLTTDSLTNLPPNSYQAFEVVRFDTAGSRLYRDDIKNIVGLIGWLVLKSDAVSQLLLTCLPVELQDALKKYASVADDIPPSSLVEELTAKLNNLLQQYVSRKSLDPAQFVSIACWNELTNAAKGIGGKAPDNIKILKNWMENFFTSYDSTQVRLRAAHDKIYFYTWSQSQCFLPVGATHATLLDRDPLKAINSQTPSDTDQLELLWCSPTPIDDDDSSDAVLPASMDVSPSSTVEPIRPKCSAFVLQHLQDWRLKNLSRGDVLIFEEVLGPKTHNPSDADPSHRQAVRLTKVQFCVDPVTNEKLVEIEWGSEDALTFPLCISSVGMPQEQCTLSNAVSVARGNVVLVDHGLTIDPLEWLGEIKPSRRIQTCDRTFCHEPLQAVPTRSELFRPILKESDLTYSTDVDDSSSAIQSLQQKTHAAVPAIQVFGFPVASEPVDAVRDPKTPPPRLVTFDDYNDPGKLLDRLQMYSDDDVRRIAAILPPQAAEYLQDVYANPNNWISVSSTLRSVPRTYQTCVAGTAGLASAAVVERGDKANNQSEFANFCSALQGALTWNAKAHLLDSKRDDQHFVVEMDNERRAHLRFGDDDLGRRPPPSTSFYARYRRGNGVLGNVGAQKIKHLVTRGPQGGAFNQVRNPFAVIGGTDFESPDHAREFAPSQFKKQRRAITTDDYTNIVRQQFGNKLQNVRTQLNWMGTWYEVAVAIDPRPEIRNTSDLIRKITASLEKSRRIGHRLRVNLPTYVPLQIEMMVCVNDGYLRAHVQRELLEKFANQRNADGSLGFFHPSKFSFGDSLYVSRMIAEAKKIRGVENVSVTRFERRGTGSQGELEKGVMEFGPLEIAQMDNDQLHPERGCFCLDLRGAR